MFGLVREGVFGPRAQSAGMVMWFLRLFCSGRWGGLLREREGEAWAWAFETGGLAVGGGEVESVWFIHEGRVFTGAMKRMDGWMDG